MSYYKNIAEERDFLDTKVKDLEYSNKRLTEEVIFLSNELNTLREKVSEYLGPTINIYDN